MLSLYSGKGGKGGREKLKRGKGGGGGGGQTLTYLAKGKVGGRIQSTSRCIMKETGKKKGARNGIYANEREKKGEKLLLSDYAKGEKKGGGRKTFHLLLFRKVKIECWLWFEKEGGKERGSKEEKRRTFSF